MAFGISPKHTQVFPLNEQSASEFLVIALEAAKKLNWNISFTSESGFIAFTKFSMSSWSEEVKVKIEDGYCTIKSECTGNQVADWGKNKKNVINFISTTEELKNTFTSEELAEKYNALQPNFVAKEEDILNRAPATTKEKITSFFALFIPTEGYFITPILINLNIIIFIIMTISGVDLFLPENESLIKWGANFKPVTLEGEPWRLFTNYFLHIGIFHLLMNMYALLYIGLLLEPHLGKARFLSVYLLTGLFASVASLWWYDLTISAGASGAIFGLYGVFLALLTTQLIEKSARQALLASIAVFVGYNILYGLKPNSGIDNAAHIGGLVSGLILGFALIKSLNFPEEKNLKYGTIGVMSIVILSTAFIVYKKSPNDIATYDTKIKEFVAMESMALEVYNLPKGTAKEELLYGIQERGIYYWNENINLIDSFQKLNLPDQIISRNQLLKEYCALRIKCYELLYKAVSEDTDQYQEQITDYNKQIESKISELGVE